MRIIVCRVSRVGTMAKRAADTYLTDQNWDKEQPEEEVGAFTVASDNVLQGRAILKAKRRCNANDDVTSCNSGAFKSFTGLTAGNRMAKVEDVSSFSFCMPLKSDSDDAQKCSKMSALNKHLMEFISVSVSNDPACNLLPVFDDYRSHVSSISTKRDDKVDMPLSTPVVPPAVSPASVTSTTNEQLPLSEMFKKSSSSWDCSTCFINNKNEASVCAACASPRPSPNESVQPRSLSPADTSKKGGELSDSGQVPLSQLFAKSSDTWECPTCMITNKSVTATCAACCCPKPTAGPDVTACPVQSTAAASSISFAAAGGFKFSLGSGQSSGTGFGQSTESSGTGFTGFSFKPPATCTVASFSFGSALSSPANAAATSAESSETLGGTGFKFNRPLQTNAGVTSAETSQPLAGTGFVFSRPLQSAGASVNFGAGSFSFANTSGFSFKPPEQSVTENKGEGEEAEPEYVPQKPESVKHVEEGSFYSVRCKLFCKADDSWNDRGTGYLSLKPCGERTQLLIRADTATGNILLNILLTSSIPVSRQGTNNVSLVCAPTAPHSSGDECHSKSPICMLIRVKTSDMADELFSHISKSKDV